MKHRAIIILRHNWEVILLFCLFGLLLARNPFSLRTLIPNIEPYPDSIHYISPALNFLHGNGFFVAREGRKMLPGVPPLYSGALLIGYLFNSDPRFFYCVNIFLAFASATLFLLLLKKTFSTQRALRFFLLFLYVTSSLLYWYPEVAMAENLLLPEALLAIYLLLLKPKKSIAILISVLSISFYATKFASLPLSLIIPVLFALHVFFLKRKVEILRIFTIFVLSLALCGGIYIAYEFFVRSNNLLNGLFHLFFSIITKQTKPNRISKDEVYVVYFSLEYARKNIVLYTRWLLGDSLSVLWKSVRILPSFLAIPAFIGIFLSFFTKKRWPAFIWLSVLITTILFMMTFYAADGRYFILAVPGLIFGLGLFLSFIEEKIQRYGKRISFFLICIFFFGFVFTQYSRIRYDILLNLRHSETPWDYISIKQVDDYLQTQHFSQKPVIISAVPPYLFDFFAQTPMTVLPLSPGQEFRTHAVEVWGDLNYKKLVEVYASYYLGGSPVFLTKYGLGNEAYLHQSYDTLFSYFKFKKILNGCDSACDMYIVTGVIDYPSQCVVH